MPYRGFIVWGVGIVVVLGSFLIFVAAGWPGEENCCIYDPNTKNPCKDRVLDKHNSCYCEAFNPAEAKSGAPGVRQPVNTWFNLYSILTSLLVAVVVYFDRQSGNASNPMRSDSWLPDLYIFALLFLGLGSMWFHASLKEWGGVFDGLSMYIYAAFLVFYSIRRLWNAEWFFWVFYSITVALFTIVGAVWQWEYKSLILILILVAAYLTFEVIIWVRTNSVMQGKPLPIVLWIGAVLCIVAATVFWALSQTDRPLCDPKSAFQPHGLLWHPLAGIMAVLLYFYWREDAQSA
jgi:hypothetical protein